MWHHLLLAVPACGSRNGRDASFLHAASKAGIIAAVSLDPATHAPSARDYALVAGVPCDTIPTNALAAGVRIRDVQVAAGMPDSPSRVVP
jgi:hypothetical protein